MRLGRNTPPPLPPLPASFTNWGFTARPRGSALRGGRNLASPPPPPARRPPPSPRGQYRAGCAGEAQYVSIELNCCGRRLYAAAEHRSARRYRVEIYGANGVSQKLLPAKENKTREIISRGRGLRGQDRASNRLRCRLRNARKRGEILADLRSPAAPTPASLCPTDCLPHPTPTPPPLQTIPTQSKRPGNSGAEFGRNGHRGQAWCLQVAFWAPGWARAPPGGRGDAGRGWAPTRTRQALPGLGGDARAGERSAGGERRQRRLPLGFDSFGCAECEALYGNCGPPLAFWVARGVSARGWESRPRRPPCPRLGISRPPEPPPPPEPVSGSTRTRARAGCAQPTRSERGRGGQGARGGSHPSGPGSGPREVKRARPGIDDGWGNSGKPFLGNHPSATPPPRRRSGG